MTYRTMRRNFQEVKDQNKIHDLLSIAKVGYLGLADEEGTYVVPLNFVWKDGKIYFHGSQEGRKVDAIQTANRVCFTVSKDNGIIANPAPANIGTAYTSVMIFGRVKPLDHLDEATAARVFDSYINIQIMKSLDNRAFFIGKMTNFSLFILSTFE